MGRPTIKKYIRSDSIYLYEPPKCKICGQQMDEYREKDYCPDCRKKYYNKHYYKEYYQRKKQDVEWYEKRKKQSREYNKRLKNKGESK